MVRLFFVSFLAVMCSALSVPVASAQGPTPEQQKQHPQLVFEMTPARIEEAIAYAKRERAPETAYPIRGGFTYGRQIQAMATTPYSRVVGAAFEAKRKYREFTAADVKPEMIAPELHIYASSGTPDATLYDVETIVIMPKGEKEMSAVVKPLRTEEVDELYRSLLGAQFEVKGMLAVFPLTMFANDHEVRIVRSGIEEIKAKIDVKKQFK